MKKIKTWFKEHKKEIIVGVVATTVTATYFLIKQKKISVQGGLRLSINMTNDMVKAYDYFNDGTNKTNYINSTYYNPDIKISELGKLGDMLKKIVDDEETTITSIIANYNEFID